MLNDDFAAWFPKGVGKQNTGQSKSPLAFALFIFLVLSVTYTGVPSDGNITIIKKQLVLGMDTSFESIHPQLFQSTLKQYGRMLTIQGHSSGKEKMYLNTIHTTGLSKPRFRTHGIIRR